MTDPAQPLLEGAPILGRNYRAEARALSATIFALQQASPCACSRQRRTAGQRCSHVIFTSHVRRDEQQEDPLSRRIPDVPQARAEALDAGIAMVHAGDKPRAGPSSASRTFPPPTSASLGRLGRPDNAPSGKRGPWPDLGQGVAVSLDAEAHDLSAAQRQLVGIFAKSASR